MHVCRYSRIRVGRLSYHIVSHHNGKRSCLFVSISEVSDWQYVSSLEERSWSDEMGYGYSNFLNLKKASFRVFDNLVSCPKIELGR